MTIDILMPALSPTMEVGTLAKWMVKEGDIVEAGDLLAEIETDKAIMEFEAVDEGKIIALIVNEGQTNIPVNSVIATISSELSNTTHNNQDSQEPKDSTYSNVEDQKITKDPPSEIQQTPSAEPQSRIFSTPLARRIAKENNIDLTKIKGSGPRGRIIKADLNTSMNENNQNIQNKKEMSQVERLDKRNISEHYLDRKSKNIEIDSMRKTIISRLTESKQNIPHYYLRRDIRVDSLLSLRSQMNKGVYPYKYFS